MNDTLTPQGETDVELIARGMLLDRRLDACTCDLDSRRCGPHRINADDRQEAAHQAWVHAHLFTAPRTSTDTVARFAARFAGGFFPSKF